MTMAFPLTQMPIQAMPHKMRSIRSGMYPSNVYSPVETVPSRRESTNTGLRGSRSIRRPAGPLSGRRTQRLMENSMPSWARRMPASSRWVGRTV